MNLLLILIYATLLESNYQKNFKRKEEFNRHFSLILKKKAQDMNFFFEKKFENFERYNFQTLLRTRAIENQCYVVAAAQTGKHNEKRQSYGHAMVVDPWGHVIAQCSERVGQFVCLFVLFFFLFKKLNL